MVNIRRQLTTQFSMKLLSNTLSCELETRTIFASLALKYYSCKQSRNSFLPGTLDITSPDHTGADQDNVDQEERGDTRDHGVRPDTGN